MLQILVWMAIYVGKIIEHSDMLMEPWIFLLVQQAGTKANNESNTYNMHQFYCMLRIIVSTKWTVMYVL